MESNVATISKEQHNAEIERLKEKYKPNTAFNVEFDSTLEFFKWYYIFLRPCVNLVASYMNQRFELSKEVKDAEILETLLMTSDVRKKVIKECGITPQHFCVVMNGLKKKGIVKDGKIIPEIIPNAKFNDGKISFKLMILFENKNKTK